MTDRTCSVEDCERQTHRAQPWCEKHYRRVLKHGDPHVDGRKTNRTCSIEGCASPHHCRGWCVKHYHRWTTKGNPMDPGVNVRDHPETCTVEGCGRPYFGSGFCQKHHGRYLRHGDPLGGRTFVELEKPDDCTVPGCDEPYFRQGCCLKHHSRMRAHGDPLAGSPPAALTCRICDSDLVDLSHYTAEAAARIIGVGPGVVRRHRAHIHDDAWWLARAEWWGNEVLALEAMEVSA